MRLRLTLVVTLLAALALAGGSALTLGRNASAEDIYADVDATPAFDYTLGSGGPTAAC
ncbi:MAG: hypothetical protein M3R26_00820 [Actinomycetota bacterium]|nr:hypothetical protein [Actinomycetota bacterium]MDQ2982930.1 hypothetical protein [Actinomycetota bacterium]